MDLVDAQLLWRCRLCPYTYCKRADVCTHSQAHSRSPDAVMKCIYSPFYVKTYK